MNENQLMLLIVVIIVIIVIIIQNNNETFDTNLVKCNTNDDCNKGKYTLCVKGLCTASSVNNQDSCETDSDCSNNNVCVDSICTEHKNTEHKNTETELDTCAPSDGRWSIPGAGSQGRSKLNSPCCNYPNYKLASDYKTCNNASEETNEKKRRCLEQCCLFTNNQSGNYDSSWYPMAQCACSLWCNNPEVNHFRKYGTAIHYISGDLATAKTSDSGDFIGFDKNNF